MSGWSEIHNAQMDHLNSKVAQTTVRILLLDKGHPEFKKMIKWCEKPRNVKGSWGPIQADDTLIYFKFWRDKDAKKFMKRFKNTSTTLQLRSYDNLI